MTELGVVLSFLIPFQPLNCMGTMRYTFPVSISCVSSAHKFMVICLVVSANVLSTSLRFFALTTVGSARWRTLPKKVINSQLLKDCFIWSTVYVRWKPSADSWNWSSYSVGRGWLMVVMSLMTSFVPLSVKVNFCNFIGLGLI